MSQRVVYLNGQFVAERDAKISIFDSALQMGDMAYEVTRTIRHQPFRLHEHLQRLRYSMQALEIDPQHLTDDELEQITFDVLARNLPTESEDVDWNIIHNVSNGPVPAFFPAFESEEKRSTVVIACFPLLEKMASLAERYTTGVDLVIPTQRSIPSGLFDAGIKCRSRAHFQLANLQAETIRYRSTAVLLDPDGFITEGTSGNVFFVRDGELLTPTAAAASEEMFLTSTSIGILHARTFQATVIPYDAPGPVTRRLSEALWRELGLDFAEQARSYAARLSQSS